MSEPLEADPDETGPLPLAGYTVAVTAARRREELGALLDRRGARVVYAPAIRIVPLADDTELVAATRAVLGAGAGEAGMWPAWGAPVSPVVPRRQSCVPETSPCRNARRAGTASAPSRR